MNENYLEILKKIGLTDYESRTYLALISLVSAKADQISKKSGVPRSKIYPVLEKLEKKELITIKQGRPLIYTVINPQESIDNYRKNMIRDLETIEDNLTKIYESKLPQINMPVISIEDKNKIIKKQNELLKRSRKTLYIRLGFILPEETETIKKLIIKALNNNVKVKILAVREFKIDNLTISIEELFSDVNVEIKYVDLPAAHLIIKDFNEMLLVFAENSGKSIQNANMVGLYNTYSLIISNYASAFNKKWSKVKN
ncbi:MAG: hypothetical protein BZ137_09945 [Methanosphaera sp. rholeuAM130]|nr:MAG: hypothetical protein BZ137_09945 [Methanosphaera sp. rholeuAM130]